MKKRYKSSRTLDGEWRPDQAALGEGRQFLVVGLELFVVIFSNL